MSFLSSVCSSLKQLKQDDKPQLLPWRSRSLFQAQIAYWLVGGAAKILRLSALFGGYGQAEDLISRG
jgi:hypothetical protein